MTGQTTAVDVVAAVFVGVGAFAAGLVPFYLFVNAEHLVPRVARELPAAAREMAHRAALSAAALLFILTAPKGAVR